MSLGDYVRRIVDLATFLMLPDGTIYQEYVDGYVRELMQKKSESEHNPCEAGHYVTFTSLGLTQPFFSDAVFDQMITGNPLEVVGVMDNQGAQYPLAFDGVSSDHAYATARFAVWDPDDVKGLIAALQTAPDVAAPVCCMSLLGT